MHYAKIKEDVRGDYFKAKAVNLNAENIINLQYTHKNK